jgi:hypothetical protein
MTYRMLAASLVMLSGIGTAAAETAPGAFVGAGAPHGGFHAGFHAGFGHAAPMGLHHFVARTRGDFFFRGREHREGEFRRWPGLAGYGPFAGYGPYDYPVGSPAYYDEPPYRYAYPDSPATAPNVFRPPLQCNTASQTVPSEKGGVATINVTQHAALVGRSRGSVDLGQRRWQSGYAVFGGYGAVPTRRRRS